MPGQDKTEGKGIGTVYYLLPLLAVVGGVIGYRAVRKRNSRAAATILTVGLLISLVYLGAGVEVYSHFTGKPGVYGMAITDVGFSNPSSVVVTVNNEGTLRDGLESVAINNGSIWFVYGLLGPSGSLPSTAQQGGNFAFGLYGYILANGTTVPVGSSAVGTEYLSPTQVDQITVPFAWSSGTLYTVAITTASDHPNDTNVVSPA